MSQCKEKRKTKYRIIEGYDGLLQHEQESTKKQAPHLEDYIVENSKLRAFGYISVFPGRQEAHTIISSKL